MAKILVVDDEPDLELLLRQKFRRKVRRGELTLIFAQNGVEALEQFQLHDDVDMVLSDINMPQMDGLTLLNQLNQLHYDLRAVIVTAYGDMKNIRTAMNRGAFDFVTKPLDFKDLETTISKTLAHLEVMRAALRSRDELVALRQEFGVAARMQESILPTRFPEDPRFEIHAWMTPAKEVGGDFYDFFELEDGRIGIVMADVSEKGVPAALFMMVSRTLMKGTAIGEQDPAKCRLDYANAGHNLPYIVKPDGEVRPIDIDAGLVLAIMPGFDFPGGSTYLEPGDVVFFYTDGITEAMDENGVEFGEDVQKHAGEADQSDDITCLSLRFQSSGP